MTQCYICIADSDGCNGRRFDFHFMLEIMSKSDLITV